MCAGDWFIRFEVYTHLSEEGQIDANLSDRHLHKLSLDYERLHFTYSQNSNRPLLDGIQSDICETINKVQSHAVLQDKILQAQVTLLMDEISQTLAWLPSGDARFEANDGLSDTLLGQTEKLRDLSAAMSNYLADLRMTRQLDLTKYTGSTYYFDGLRFGYGDNRGGHVFTQSSTKRKTRPKWPAYRASI